MSRIHFALTRFTDKTTEENERFLTRINRAGSGDCIIGGNQPISDKIPQGALVLVIIMHIADTSQKDNKKTREQNDYVSGICLLENNYRPDRYCQIYDDIEYNQVTYLGQDRIDRAELIAFNPLLIEVLDIILFKGKGHQKRFKHISMLNDDFLENRKKVKSQQNIYLLPRQELRDLNVKRSILDIFQHKSHMMTDPAPALPHVTDFLDEEMLDMFTDVCPEDEVEQQLVNDDEAVGDCCPEEFFDGARKRMFDDDEELVNEDFAFLLDCCPDDFFEKQPNKRHETAFYNDCEIEVAEV